MPKPDLNRIRQTLEREQLDGVIAFDHWTMSHLSGHMGAIPVAPGDRFVLVPAADNLDGSYCCWDFEETRIIENSWIRDVRPNPSWLDIREKNSLQSLMQRSGNLETRPVQLKGGFAVAALVDALAERGLRKARLGVELAALTGAKEAVLRSALPDAELVDVSALLVDLRSVKTAEEIELLRSACSFADAGVRAILAQGDKLVGKTASSMRLTYLAGVADAALNDSNGGGVDSAHIGVSCQGRVAPTRGFHEDRVGESDIIWLDYGASVNGYYSDAGRTCIVGQPEEVTQHIGQALRAGLEAALAEVRPGAPLSNVFHAGMKAVRESGLHSYNRGHIGHAIGIGGGEWAPFVAPNEARLMEPGMTLAVEVPLYVHGLGGFQFENDIVVTETGYKTLTGFPNDFLTLS